MGLISKFAIPTNPGYDTTADAEGQPQLVNPVTLANAVVIQANAAVEITDIVIDKRREMAQAKVTLKAAQYALSAFEATLLSQFPAPPGDRKSNKLLEVYIRTTAESVGRLNDYEEHHEEISSLEATVTLLDAEIESGWQAYNLLKMMGEHVQTHLSFKKHELSSIR